MPPQRADAYLNVKVDDSNLVAESNENNNIGSLALPLPNLVVSNISLGDGGQTSNGYVVTIANIGSVSVDVNGVGVSGYYAATQNTWPTNAPACGSSVQSGSPVILAPNNTLTIHVGCSNDPPPAGAPWLNVKVDDTNLVAESNESDNVFGVSTT